MSEPEKAGRNQDGTFAKGVSGNPAGKPKGSRHKLGEAFLSAMHDDFVEHGVSAIETVRTKRPDQYLKVIASMLPKELNLNVNDAESMTDDELIARIRELDAAIHPFLAGREGAAEQDSFGSSSDECGSARPSRVH